MASQRHSWQQKASTGVIKTARKLFANTPIQKLPLTTKIYTKVFRFGNPNDEVTVDFRDTKLTVPTKDTTIVPGLVGGFYEKLELDIFERIAGVSKTVVDVGANIGLYSCLAAANAPEGAEVIAFEPVGENQAYLRRNIEQNGHKQRVLVEEKAVGERDGNIEIFLVEGSIGTHSPSSKNALGSKNSVSVPMVSLDSYSSGLKKPVDLLKVDVEGYEGAVLKGAAKLLKEDEPALFVEFVPFHLQNCDFEPEEFVDIIFGIYKHVFIVDEPRATIKACSRKDLLGSGGDYKNANLIASDQPRHLDEIDKVRQSLK